MTRLMKCMLVKIFLLILFSPAISLAQTLIFDSAVKVKKMEESSFVEQKAGGNLKLRPGEYATVVNSKGLPLLVYVPQNSNSEIKISDVNLSDIANEYLQPQVNDHVNQIITGLRQIDVYIQKRDYTNAQSTINALKSKFPKTAAVLFMSGTVSYLNRNTSGAIDDLTKGLAIDPSNVAAQKLLSELKGEKR